MKRRTKTSHIVIHTAAFEDDAGVDLIRKWHTDPPDWVTENGKRVNKGGNGWGDIGYHFVIRRDGTVEKGRDLWRQGAHCSAGGMNAKSVGVCFEGHGDHEPFTRAQVLGFMDLYLEIRRRAHVKPSNIIGHREAYTGRPQKTCPGTKIDMITIRRLTEAWLKLAG